MSEWRESARSKGLERARLFSWARTAELTLGSYRKVLAEARPPARRKASKVAGR